MLSRSLTLAVLLNANFMIHPCTLIIQCISLVIWLLRVHIVLHYPVESVLWVNHLPTFKANFLKAPFLDPKVGTVYYSKLFCSMLWPELLWKVDISSDLHVLIVGFTRGARMVRRDYRDECRRHKLWPSRRSFCIQKHQETLVH